MGESAQRQGIGNTLTSAIEGLFGAIPDEEEPAERAPKRVGLPPAAAKGKGGKTVWEEPVVAEAVCAALAVPGVLMQFSDGIDRPWWIYSAKQVSPISEPLTRMLNKMSPEAIKLAQRYLDPAFLAFGCAAVVGPAVRMEVALREEIRAHLREQAQNHAAPGAGRDRAAPPYAVDTAADARAAASPNGHASSDPLHPPRTRLDRLQLGGNPGFGMEPDPDLGG